MNKKLIGLPILALVMCGLASCGEGPTEIYNGNASNVPDVKPSEEREHPETDEPETFGGYKRIEAPEDGKDYLLGIFQYNLGKMLFMNGKPHTDENGVYPYYFGTNQFDVAATDSNIEEGAVSVHIDYIKDDSGNPTNEFTIKVNEKVDPADPTENYYANKYVQVYGDYNEEKGKYYTSIRCDEIGATYGSKNEGVAASNWSFISSYAYQGITYKVKAIAVKNFQNALTNQSNLSGTVGLATHDNYFTVEAETANYLFDSMIAHFWEKITPVVPE